MTSAYGNVCKFLDTPKTSPGWEEHRNGAEQIAVRAPTVLENEVFEDVVANLQCINALHPLLQTSEFLI
jgi:hypothetical protein